jgi:hypothetical protein
MHSYQRRKRVANNVANDDLDLLTLQLMRIEEM